jgi:type VI protein secretion system component VasK
MRHRPDPNAKLYETHPRLAGIIGLVLAAICGWVGIVWRIQDTAPGENVRISMIGAVACVGFGLIGLFLLLFGQLAARLMKAQEESRALTIVGGGLLAALTGWLVQVVL